MPHYHYATQCKKIGIFVLLSISLFLHTQFVFSQSFEHPRGLIKKEELSKIRERLNRKPYNSFLDNLKNTCEGQIERLTSEETPSMYSVAYASSMSAALYLLTEENQWAETSWKYAQLMMKDSLFFNNPTAFGLTRAMLLKNLAWVYDFCYPAWDETKRKLANEKLFGLMKSVNMTMGPSANYNIESNWMGVRYGSVIMASCVIDPLYNGFDMRKRVKSIQWDATSRIREHIEKNIYSNGWNAESLGYFGYGWSFVGPALITLNNNSGIDVFSLENWVPHVQNSLWGMSTAMLNIQHTEGRGIKPDFSDDNLMSNILPMYAMGLRLFPDTQHSYLKWMHNYLFDKSLIAHPRGYLFMSLLYYPENIEAANPATLDWLNYHDPDQGVVLFRNRFEDENDIVGAYSATAKRVRGHQGPDTNTFRIIGLGAPWIIGAGRTGNTAGQSNLFPSAEETIERGSGPTGVFLDYQLNGNGSGYARGAGSCTGVIGHQRLFMASFEQTSGAEAVFIVSDKSVNGQRWRINTPEFNTIIEEKDGFTMKAPNGSTLKATVLDHPDSLHLETGKLRYGGKTTNKNPGIMYQGKTYEYSNFIDVFCDGDITVVLTLQPKGKKHPPVSKNANEIIVGTNKIALP